MKFKASIGLSRKWDAYEAGKEVAQDALQRLGSRPKFVVLTCTYEYYKNGGYEELLNGVWEVLPEETKLIGGVTSGFIIPQGCFSHGAAMLAVSGDMDVATGFGKHTKGTPRRAGKKAGKEIRKKLSNSRYKNGFVIEFTSGPLLPKIPFFGNKKFSRSKIKGWLLSVGLPILGWFEWGLGREESVREAFTKELYDFKVIGISTWDDSRFRYHREFLGNKVYNNSIVALGIKWNLDSWVKTSFGFKKTEKGFRVTETDRTGVVIKKINGKPAFQEYIKTLGWNPNGINENHLKKSIFVFPAFEKNGSIYPAITSIYYGDCIGVGRRIDVPELRIMTASGKSLLGAVDEVFENFSGEPKLAIIAECAARQEALGANLFTEKRKIENYLKGSPYIAFFSGGEHTYTPEQGSRHKHESFNIAILKE